MDGVRHFTPEPRSFIPGGAIARPTGRDDKGRRLDHIWTSPALADRVSNIAIAKEARGWERPSDHVPVTATIEV